MRRFATVSVTVDGVARERPGRPLSSVLDDLAGLVGCAEEVQGVEIREPGQWGARAHAVVAYTAPATASKIRGLCEDLAVRLGLSFRTEVQVIDDDGYLDAWKSFHRPFVAGRSGSLLVRPSWCPRRLGDPEDEVVLDPGRAFGTGRHESTRLCLSWIADAAPPYPVRVLDAGCGSGILALAAARRFGAEVVAIDADPDAVEVARENAARNALDVAVFHTPLASAPAGPFDLVLANIRPDVLVGGAAALARRLAADGTAILSGILEEEADAVLAAYRAQDLHATVVGAMEGWVILDARKRPR